jgi:hypothetical protein
MSPHIIVRYGLRELNGIDLVDVVCVVCSITKYNDMRFSWGRCDCGRKYNTSYYINSITGELCQTNKQNL